MRKITVLLMLFSLTLQSQNYEVQFIGDEYKFICDSHHFMTLVSQDGMGNDIFDFRPHPGMDINGWGSSWYAQPFLSGATIDYTIVDSVIAYSNSIIAYGHGNVAQGTSGTYGTWNMQMEFQYDNQQKEITGNGSYEITLDGQLSGSTGDLSLYKIASNYLNDVPLLCTGGNGDTGDMEFVAVDGVPPIFPFDWFPTDGNTFPYDFTDFLSIDVKGNYNNVNTMSQGYGFYIEPAYKPSLKVVMTSNIPNIEMIYGSFYNSAQSTEFDKDNVGITPLIVNSSSLTNFSFNLEFESVVPVPQVDSPEIYPDVDIFSGEIGIALSCDTIDAEIHYTLDGTEPKIDSPLYSDTIFVDSTVTVSTKAYKCNLEVSEITSHTFTQYNTIVDLKVFLSGPFDNSEMNTGLNAAGLIPLQQPYNVAPWNYGGNENVSVIPNSNVVDWVLVELRQTIGGPETAVYIIEKKAGFLLNNGKIVSTDGLSPLTFETGTHWDVYAVVHHRNHLSIMSANPLNAAKGSFSYDFSTDATQVYGGVDAHTEISPGMWGMTSGDGNRDSEITMQDKTGVWDVEAGSQGYVSGDYNLDVQVSNPDKNDKFLPNEGATSFVSEGFYCADSITDARDGQKYKIVQIGSQCWMAQNLNIGMVINGGNNQINNDTIEKYCYGNDTNNCAIYGGLYKWDEMMQYVTTEGTQGICPDSWHLPTDEEWKMLEGAVDSQYGYPDPVWNYTGLRGSDVGGNLKEIGTTHWNTPNTEATNSSGFTALPGGYGLNGSFGNHLTHGNYSTSSESGSNAWYRNLYSFRANVYRQAINKNYSISVRCIKD